MTTLRSQGANHFRVASFGRRWPAARLLFLLLATLPLVLLPAGCAGESGPETGAPGGETAAPPAGSLPQAGSTDDEAPRGGSTARRVATGASVVLIVVDTLRRDHLGCYGYPKDTSPNIDALAADGVRYDHAISQAPWTTPSVGSLLTSRFPSFLGIQNVRSVLSQDLVMLPEALRDAGHATGAVISHTFCSAKWGFDQGFDFFDESNIVGYRQTSSAGVTDRALDFLDERAGEPFFLWLHYFDPHNKYVLHPEFDRFGQPGYTGPVDGQLAFTKMRRVLDTLTAADIQEIHRYYDSEIAFTDHHIGRVLQRLRQAGIYDDTMIVFTADHGEEFRDHGRLGHSHSLYQELVNVPLIIKYPGGEPGTVAGTIGLIDVYPTILDVLGVPAPAGLEGISLAGSGGDAAGTGDGDKGHAGSALREIFTETSRKGTMRGVVTDRHKLIRHLNSGRVELYDLQADPTESDDIAKQEAGHYHRLRAILDGWMREMAASKPAGNQVELTDEQIKQLKSLGYLDGE